MPKLRSRLDYLREHAGPAKRARAFAALNEAGRQQNITTRDPWMPAKNSLNGKHIVIIGSGVGGLTTAYELLSRNDAVKVTVLEARDRTGGRCLTLRTGDTLTEDKNSDLESPRGESQVVRFERPVGDKEPYLNAGPGRIPSSHKRLLDYLRRFGVEVEIYVMASESNLTQMENGPEGDGPIVNRRLNHNTRGWLAEMVHRNAKVMLEDSGIYTEEREERLRSLMVTFGQLTKEGRYEVGTAEPGQDETEKSDRAGFNELPGVRPGEIADAIKMEQLLDSQFWKKTRFYQPVDFLWQPTMFQPVGGMDQVQHAFAQKVAALGGMIHLNSPVKRIDYDEGSAQFLIEAEGHIEPFRADYCFCNLAIPFLQKILSERLQNIEDPKKGFSMKFKEALQAVYKAQTNPIENKRFLACTTKVGWQANRDLWQGKTFKVEDETKNGILAVNNSEVGVVPIYGGISWTDHPITQVWYPSSGYHDIKGVLTGCYNFSEDACRNGHMTVEERLIDARAGAARFGAAFAAGLERGVAIAWQNMRYIKGGWAQWLNVEDCVNHYNNIIQGTAVDEADKPNFFIVGDQVSSLPGWQEGAVASALNAISRLVRPDLALPYLAALPDTELMVESL